MLAIYKKELRAYFTSVIGWMFLAFFLAFVGLYVFLYNFLKGEAFIGYALAQVSLIFALLVPMVTMRSMAEEKKQIPLRLNAKLYAALAAWAEDDFRSVNGQIEYLLTECVRQRKKNGKYVGEEIDVPPELDIS